MVVIWTDKAGKRLMRRAGKMRYFTADGRTVTFPAFDDGTLVIPPDGSTGTVEVFEPEPWKKRDVVWQPSIWGVRLHWWLIGAASWEVVFGSLRALSY